MLLERRLLRLPDLLRRLRRLPGLLDFDRWRLLRPLFDRRLRLGPGGGGAGGAGGTGGGAGPGLGCPGGVGIGACPGGGGIGACPGGKDSLGGILPDGQYTLIAAHVVACGAG